MCVDVFEALDDHSVLRIIVEDVLEYRGRDVLFFLRDVYLCQAK